MIAYRVVPVALAALVVVACSGTDAVVNDPDAALAPDTGGGDAAAGNDAGGGSDTGVITTDGGLGDPASIDLTFSGKCALFTPCGGDVVGTWDYNAGCVSDPWAGARKYCQALVVKNQKGKVKGRITFTSTTVTRDVTTAFSASLTLPASCFSNTQVNCTDVASGLKQAFNSATCTAAAGGCDCDVATTQTVKGSGTSYTIQGNQIVLQDGNKYDYCVNGTTLQSTHVAGAGVEPGVYELTKR